MNLTDAQKKQIHDLMQYTLKNATNDKLKIILKRITKKHRKKPNDEHTTYVYEYIVNFCKNKGIRYE